MSWDDTPSTDTSIIPQSPSFSGGTAGTSSSTDLNTAAASVGQSATIPSSQTLDQAMATPIPGSTNPTLAIGKSENAFKAIYGGDELAEDSADLDTMNGVNPQQIADKQAFQDNLNAVTGGQQPSDGGTPALTPAAGRNPALTPAAGDNKTFLQKMGAALSQAGQNAGNKLMQPLNLPTVQTTAPAPLAPPAINQPSMPGPVAQGNTTINPFQANLSQTPSDKRAKTEIKPAKRDIYGFLNYLGKK